jgi:hypothetical protein
MSSTIIVQKEVWHPSWMPNSRVFSFVTKTLYEELRDSDRNLAQVFLDASNSQMSSIKLSQPF